MSGFFLFYTPAPEFDPLLYVLAFIYMYWFHAFIVNIGFWPIKISSSFYKGFLGDLGVPLLQ